MRQYNYLSTYKTWKISESAYEALKNESTSLGMLRVVRGPDDGEDIDEAVVVKDHLWTTDDGDVFRRREQMTDMDDTYDMLGSNISPERVLLGIYQVEWEQQEYDDMQQVWFRWEAANDGVPEELSEELPRRCDP